MNKLAIVAIALVTLAGCAELRDSFSPASASAAAGTSYKADGQRPEWLRDPGQGEYPYNTRGW